MEVFEGDGESELLLVRRGGTGDGREVSPGDEGRENWRTLSNAISAFSTGLSSGGPDGGGDLTSSFCIGDGCLTTSALACGVPCRPIAPPPLRREDERGGERPPSPCSSMSMHIEPVDDGRDSPRGGAGTARLPRREEEEEEGRGGGAICWRCRSLPC